MIDPQLKQQVIDKVKECKQIALDKLKLDLGPIKISFDLKGRRAGLAKRIGCNNLEIKLNEDYLIKKQSEMLNDTIPHEVAHLAADLYWHTNCHHDYRWQNIMRSIYKLEPNRTHSFGPSATSRNTRKHTVICGNCDKQMKVTTRLANKIVRSGRLAYWNCGFCKNKLGDKAEIILDNT